MKLGLFVPLAAPVATPDFVGTLGREADALGFDSLWVAEHVVLFDDHVSRYPYSPDGRFPATYAEAGADQVILTSFARDAEALHARLEGLAATLLPAARRL